MLGRRQCENFRKYAAELVVLALDVILAVRYSGAMLRRPDVAIVFANTVIQWLKLRRY